MKIDSSMIGMESARRYSSVTKKTATASLVGMEVMQGRELEKDNFSDLLNTGTQDESGNFLLDENSRVIASRATYKTSSSITSVSEKKTLQSVREMCVHYLIRWLYTNIGAGRGQSDKQVDEYMNGYRNDYLGGNQVQSINQTGGSYQFGQFKLNMSYYHEEVEQTEFSTVGTVKTSDGREINFNLGLTMSRSFQEYAQTASVGEFVQMTDPLVINLDTDMATLSDQKFEFDLDCDGIKDSISQLGGGNGFLALDKNGDGNINDGSELFGTKSGDGFADLAKYDEDGNGWIDENDAIFEKLLVWTKDENGKDELYTLKEAGVGAMCLQKAETDFSLNSLKNNQTNGRIRSTGIFLYENGNVGTMQQLDLAQ
ncbi:MAG: hypothetical protein E7289_03340 [Lachnospiraceae bacterium]|nr:hypothetical protein [Lachnospiraceae bacterium]